MDGPPSFGSSLAQVFVAHTIAFDNTFEAWMPHVTTLFGPGGPPPPVIGGSPIKPPWLVSRVMWENVLRRVPREGLAFESLAESGGNVGGLLRWGYLARRGGLVRLTRGGHVALRVWNEIDAGFDDGWRRAFGAATIDRLLAALACVAEPFADETYRFVPTSTYGNGMRLPRPAEPQAAAEGLAGALSRVLQLVTQAYEARSTISLAIGANVLRVLGPEPLRQRDLPFATGISREAVDGSVSFLQHQQLIDVLPGPEVVLTSHGEARREDDLRILRAVESDWSRRVGASALHELEAALTDVLGSPALPAALLPRPGGWRSQGRYRRLTDAVAADPRGRLPQQPVQLHRGGFPDGS